MWAFLKRLNGSTKKQVEEDARFKRNLELLEKQGAELDQLQEKIDRVCEVTKDKQESLRAEAISHSASVMKTVSRGTMKAITAEEEEAYGATVKQGA